MRRSYNKSDPLIFGFTGTRKGMSRNQELGLRKFFQAFNQDEIIKVHHGCCVGSDKDFHLLIREIFYHANIVAHPPKDQKLMTWDLDYEERFEPQDYMVRNRHIVDCCQILIATPEGQEVQRSGTWATIRYALKKPDKTVLIFR